MSVHKTIVLGCALVVAAFVSDSGVNAGVGDPCNMFATSASGVLFACPQGDGDTLASGGLTITVTVLDNISEPIPNVPAADIWIIGCTESNLVLCGGSGAISASGPTDANGVTTITTDFAAGGCDLGGIRVVVQGFQVGAGVCGDPCLPIKIKSADINKSYVVNLVDFSIFGGASGYPSPPKPYNECIDYTAPFGTVTLPDFAKYGTHNNHTC